MAGVTSAPYSSVTGSPSDRSDGFPGPVGQAGKRVQKHNRFLLAGDGGSLRLAGVPARPLREPEHESGEDSNGDQRRPGGLEADGEIE